jgi:uncharacterized membrane protein
MQIAASTLVFFLTAFLGLWPLAFLFAVLRHGFARRWLRAGQAALLLPLWTIAASVGLIQLSPLLALLDGKDATRSPFVAVTALGFALCCATAAWALLRRTFDTQQPPPGSTKMDAESRLSRAAGVR